MEINEEILTILSECKIDKNDGVCYLFSLHHGYTPSYIPDRLKREVNMSGIVENNNQSIEWKIPFYKGGENNFDWVKTEYVTLFSLKNPKKGGKVREATARMKKLFASNPEIRKDEVLIATGKYLRETNRDFIRLPHYFIEKGVGANKVSDLLDWIDKYREYLKTTQPIVTDNVRQILQ